MPVEYHSNPDLAFIKPSWPGNPLEKGRFLNLGEPFDPEMGTLLRWFLSPNPQRKEKKSDTWRPKVVTNNPSLSQEDNFIMWLGHASFFIRLNGVSLITDPVFFDVSVVKRHIRNVCDPMQLRDIDYVLLSHDHRDHCDEKSLKLLRKHNDFKMLTALNMEPLVRKWLPQTPIQEAGWYQEYQLEESGLKITFLPAYHWGRRYLTDTRKRLWGSFMIQGAGKTIYFAADSGYKSHFKEIGELFPDIDLSMIGVGAYKPSYMMNPIHTSPDEALRAFRDLGARKLLPMHYGTYDLSDEPMGEPYRRLQHWQDHEGLEECICLADVGEMLKL